MATGTSAGRRCRAALHARVGSSSRTARASRSTDMRALSTRRALRRRAKAIPELGPEPGDPGVQRRHARRRARAPPRRDQAGAARSAHGRGHRQHLRGRGALAGEDQPESEGGIAERAPARAADRRRFARCSRTRPRGATGRSTRARGGTSTIARARSVRAAARRSGASCRRDDRRTTVRWTRRADAAERSLERHRSRRQSSASSSAPLM